MIQNQKLLFNSYNKFLILFKSQKTICFFLMKFKGSQQEPKIYLAVSKSVCMKKPRCDMIASADQISNLCHIKYAVRENETPNEKELRKKREELQAWNEVFWTKHNLNFIRKKKEFLVNKLNKKGSTNNTLSADEISIFYKDFLDKNWKTHLTYLFEWYKKNAFVTYLHFRVSIENIFKKVYRNA